MNSIVNLKDGFITFNSNIDYSLSFSKCGIGYSNYNINSHERGSLVFLTNNNADTTNISMHSDIRMCIASDGNVGIGTNNPNYKLDIQGSAAQTLRIMDTRATGDAIISLKELNDSNGFDMAYIGTIGDKFYIRGYNNSATPRVDFTIDRITSNVGIGMTDPKYKLDVSGTINASNILINGSIVTANNQQWITSSSNVYTSNLLGNVGIGITNPSYKCHIKTITDNIASGLHLDADDTGSNPNKYALTIWPSLTGGQVGWKFRTQNSVSGGVNIPLEFTNSGSIRFKKDIWHSDSDGNARLYFNNAEKTYIRGHGTTPIEFRNGADATIATFSSTGNLNITGSELYVGPDSGSSKIFLGGGAAGDTGYNHSVIESRNYSSTENTELLLFKGNDVGSPDSADRIRLRAGAIVFDTYPGASVDRVAENIRMVINGSGNVGVGTLTPLSGNKFHVEGNTYLNGDTSINGTLVVNSNLIVHGATTKLNTDVFTTERLELTNAGSSTSFLLSQTSPSNANNILNVINSATSNVFNITSTGNIGIGTNNPNYKLDIQGSAAQTLRIMDTRATGDAIISLKELNDSNGFDMAYIGTTEDRFYIRAYNNSATPRVDFAIDRATGNVGIGMTNPTSKLHITTTASTNLLDFRNVDNFGIYATSLGIGSRGNTLDFLARDFNNNNGIATRNILSLRPEGNVGIGTNNPLSLLDINTTSYTGAILTLDAGIANATTQMARSIGKPLMKLGKTSYSTTVGDYYGIGFGYSPLPTDFSCAEIGVLITSASGAETGDIVFSTRPVITNDAPTERMRIASNGNVGIGTNSTIQSKLTINPIVTDNSGFNHSEAPLTITNPTPTSSSVLNDPKSVLHLCRQGTGSQAHGARASFKLCRYENSTTNSRTRLDITLAHNSYDDINTMSITSGGNVGIGTTAPNSMLDIVRTSTSGVAVDMLNTRFDNNWGLKVQQNYVGTGDIRQNIIHRYNAIDYNSLTFKGANVGIGTNNPSCRLQVGNGGQLRIANGDTDFSIIGTMTDDSSFNTRIVVSGNNRSDYPGRIDYISTTGDHIFCTTYNTTERMRIANNGNVGIGTNNPSAYTLQVNGTIGASGNITAFYSDERLKNITEYVSDVLPILSKINVFKYNCNDLAASYGYDKNKKEIGLSAQEVQKYYPEVVSIAPFDSEYDEETKNITSKSGENYLTLDYERLVPILLQGIKDLNNKVVEMEENEKNMKNELNNIKSRLDKLELR